MQLHDLVDAVTGDEPPLARTVDDIILAGRRAERRRRAGFASAGAAGLVAVAVAGAFLLPALAAELALAGRRIAVLAVHTLPPVGSDRAERRDAQLARTAAWVREQRAAGLVPVVVGDLNASPFSAAFRGLLAAGLVDSQRGFGLQASWPVGHPVPPIAIDHCLHDPALVTTARALGPALGSDHLPVRIDLAWSAGQVP